MQKEGEKPTDRQVNKEIQREREGGGRKKERERESLSFKPFQVNW